LVPGDAPQPSFTDGERVHYAGDRVPAPRAIGILGCPISVNIRVFRHEHMFQTNVDRFERSVTGLLCPTRVGGIERVNRRVVYSFICLTRPQVVITGVDGVEMALSFDPSLIAVAFENRVDVVASFRGERQNLTENRARLAAPPQIVVMAVAVGVLDMTRL